MKLSSRFEGRGNGTGRSVRKTKQPHQDRAAVHTSSPAARNLALAHHIERLIRRGVIADYTAAARMLGVSQPRMSHLMGLLLLAPRIQETILAEKAAPRDKELRKLARLADWRTQESALAHGTDMEVSAP